MSGAAVLLISFVANLAPVDGTPEDEDVVAGWTAFGLFGLLILAVVVLGFSLTKRLKNVASAADQGLYDPSDPKPEGQARGLAAARQMREQAARESAPREEHGGDDRRPG